MVLPRAKPATTIIAFLNMTLSFEASWRLAEFDPGARIAGLGRICAAGEAATRLWIEKNVVRADITASAVLPRLVQTCGDAHRLRQIRRRSYVHSTMAEPFTAKR